MAKNTPDCGFMAGAMKKAAYSVESCEPKAGKKARRINK